MRERETNGKSSNILQFCSECLVERSSNANRQKLELRRRAWNPRVQAGNQSHKRMEGHSMPLVSQSESCFRQSTKALFWFHPGLTGKAYHKVNNGRLCHDGRRGTKQSRQYQTGDVSSRRLEKGVIHCVLPGITSTFGLFEAGHGRCRGPGYKEDF
jgi:hypothetical protein